MLRQIISMFSVYRNPDRNNCIFDCLLTSLAAIQGNDSKSGFLIVGYFHAHHKEYLSSVSPTNCHGL